MSLLLDHISFRHNNSEPNVVEDVSLRIEPGELAAVLGANGSGKSTLLHLMAGLLLPDVGRVVVDGIDSKDRQKRFALRQSVGIVFQQPDYQIVSQTVEDDVAFGLENLNLPPDQIRLRVHQALDRMGLLAQATHSPDTLSGGQLQRLALAGVLALTPRYVLLDEPFAWLDQAAQQTLWQTLKDLAQSGIAVVVVTHHTDLLADASRVVVTHRGHIVAETTPDSLGRQPHIWTEAQLPEPPLTALSGALRASGRAVPVWYSLNTALDWLDGRESQLHAPQAGSQPCYAAPSSSPYIALQNVGFSHDKNAPTSEWLFSELDFSLGSGDWTTLCGPSGCGKSTLVQLLNGLHRPLAGSVLVNGQSIANQPTALLCKRVGMVFQNPRHQHFALTVAEEMGFALLESGVPPTEVLKRIRSICEQLALDEKLLERAPNTLSGGEQIKVALGSILLLQPQALILDETLTALDPAARQDMLDLLDTLHHKGLSILNVSHRPQQLPTPTQYAWLERGALNAYTKDHAPLDLLPELEHLSALTTGQRTHDLEALGVKLLSLKPID